MKKVDDVYLIEDSLEDLLKLISNLYYQKIIPRDIKNINIEKNIIDNYIYLEIDLNIYKIFIKKIISILDKYTINNIVNVYLSENEDKEIIIYYYIINALKYPKIINSLRTLSVVLRVEKLSKYVRMETHKMKGFLRFMELNNHVLYAKFSPTNNIIFKLINHFKERLGNNSFIIHDVKRNILVFYNGKNIKVLHGIICNKSALKITSEEEKYQKLWKEFFKTIGIKERKNSRCQMNFMPKKYWNYLIEMSDKYANN